jgi:hypothetical protein
MSRIQRGASSKIANSEGGGRKEKVMMQADTSDEAGVRLGQTVEDMYKHSWRAEPVERWIWVPKPMIQGGKNTQPVPRR